MLSNFPGPTRRDMPFTLLFNRLGLKKIQLDQATLIAVTPGWQNTVLVSSASANVNKESLVTSKCFRSFDRAKQASLSADRKKNMQLLAWTVSGKSCLQYYRKSLPSLLQMPEDQGQSLTTNRPDVSAIAGAVGEKLIPLDGL